MFFHPEAPIASWDFESCIEVLRQSVNADQSCTSGPKNASAPGIPNKDQDVDNKTTPSLGNFDAIFKHIGANPIDIPREVNYFSSSDETLVDVGSYSTAASSPPNETPEDLDQYMTTKAIRYDEDVQNYNSERKLNTTPVWENSTFSSDEELPNHTQSELNTPRLSSAARTQLIAKILHSDHKAGGPLTTAARKSKAHHDNLKKISTEPIVPPSAKHLTPAWVTPPTVRKPTSVSFVRGPPIDTPHILLDPAVIRPLLYATRGMKQRRIGQKLLAKFEATSTTLEDDLIRSLHFIGGNEHPDGIHVFVDSSNIAIGFVEALKRARGINKNEFTKFPPLAYHSLALIMERGRDVAKRVLVGSSRDNVRLDYMLEAAQCGYEVSTLERVEKFKEAKESDIEKYRRLGVTGHYTSSGSGGEAPLNAFKTVTEQGVDEILHMKMLESIVDTKDPSTMVLATGDAAAAEYSSGFLRNVERALERGWKVELVAWKSSMSSAYRDKAFRRKWEGKFIVVELDDFQEELLGIYAYETVHRTR